MRNIYLYTNSKDRITNARLQRPAKVGEICRIYVDGQHTFTAQACKVSSPELPCYHCCMTDIYRGTPNTCIIPVEYSTEVDDYLGQVCCGDPGCYFKDVTDLMEEL